MSTKLVTISTRAGEAVITGGHTIIPFAQVLSLRLFKIPVRFTWNRPVSVLVINQDGQEEVIAVPDVTRVYQLILLGIGLTGSFFIWLTSYLLKKTRRTSHA